MQMSDLLVDYDNAHSVASLLYYRSDAFMR